MRHLVVTLMVAASIVLVPAWTMAGNQKVAEQVAAKLRESGQLHGYKIGVKCQDGTAWVRGAVADHEQMNTALNLVLETPGVTRVVNNLTIRESGEEVAAAVPQSAVPVAAPPVKQAAADLAQRQPAAQPVMAQPRLVAQPTMTPPHPANRVSTSFYAAPVTPVNATAATEPTPAPQAVPTPTLPTPTLPTPTLPAPAVQQAPWAPQAATAPPVTRMVIAQAPQVVAAPPVAGMVVPQAVAPPMMGTPMYGQPMYGRPMYGRPIPVAYINQGQPMPLGQPGASPMPPQYVTPVGGTVAPARHDQPHMPNYAWPSYAPHPNYAAVTYPKQHSPTAWPYIGPFYPYPQVPLGWRKVTLEWHDGWWQLDFDDGSKKGLFSGLFRPSR